jgi:transposase
MSEAQMDTIDTAVLAREVSRSPKRRRQSYSREEKLRIVQETLKPGASVSVVARRHDVNANLVFTWRRHHQQGSLLSAAPRPRKPKLLPVIVQPDEAEHGPRKSDLAQREVLATPIGRIEIEFPGGGRLRTDGRVDADTLRAAIRELSQP